MADNTSGHANPQTPEDFTTQIAFLREKGHSVRTTDEEASMLANNKLLIDNANHETLNKFDKDILEMSGIERKMVEKDGKKGHEKTHVYMKGAFAEQNIRIAELTASLKTNQDAMEAAQVELSTLKSANPETKFQEEIKRIHESHSLSISGKDTEIEKLQKLRQSDSFSNMLDREISEFSPRFKKETVGKDRIIRDIKREVSEMAFKKGENGEYHSLKADGTPDLNTQDSSFKSPNQIFAEKFADYLIKVDPQGGTGQTPAAGKDAIVVQNAGEIITVLNAEGFILGSPAAMKRRDELRATIPK